jgi:hypothetical protein
MPIEVISKLKAKNNGQFALLDDIDLKGGYRIVDNLTERNNISADKRKAGMKVAVISTDIVYKLNDDLTTWCVDKTETLSLQDAYNNGNTIAIIGNRPTIIQTEETNLISLFEIQDSVGNKILSANNESKVVFNKQLQGKEYTSSITAAIQTNSSDITLDVTNRDIYRAVQYFYTVSNSDGSGYETGQLFVIHDGFTATIYAIMGNSINTPCGISFNSILSGHNLYLKASTDNSGSFSRIVHLFKIALI